MKNLTLILFINITTLLFACSFKKQIISDKDKEHIEILLSKYKRYAFVDLYEKSILQSEKKYNLKKCDSIFDISSTELHHEYCLFMDFHSKEHQGYIDENYNAMIKKWLNKDYSPYMPLDNPEIKTNMEFKRALDFYDSIELKKYLDSLRIIYYKKYKNNELRGLDCIRDLK
jgi:hypothetical protein